MANMNTGEVRHVAQRAENQDALLMAARVGYAVNGVLHLLIGWIALSLAWGLGSSQSADQSGALGALASNTFGRILLWIAVVGWLGLGLWHLLQAVLSRGEAKDRLEVPRQGCHLPCLRLAGVRVRPRERLVEQGADLRLHGHADEPAVRDWPRRPRRPGHRRRRGLPRPQGLEAKVPRRPPGAPGRDGAEACPLRLHRQGRRPHRRRRPLRHRRRTRTTPRSPPVSTGP